MRYVEWRMYNCSCYQAIYWFVNEDMLIYGISMLPYVVMDIYQNVIVQCTQLYMSLELIYLPFPPHMTNLQHTTLKAKRQKWWNILMRESFIIFNFVKALASKCVYMWERITCFPHITNLHKMTVYTSRQNYYQIL